MIFPLSVGNTWIYEVSISCISDGAPWDRTYERRDRITGRSEFKGQDFLVLEREMHADYLLRLEGESVLYISGRDTVWIPWSPLKERRYESLPWTAFDLTPAQDSSRTLFSADTTYDYGYENMLYVVRDYGHAVVDVPAGHYDAHHIEVAFSVGESGQTWSSRTDESVHYFIAEGIGIVKEAGHRDHDDSDPGTSFNCHWTAELTSYKLME
jgi:hypothetical protein